MPTAGEPQELRQIGEGLRDTDRWFAWRLILLQGVLRWAAPGRQVYLLILAVLAAAVLRLAAAACRLLTEVAQAAMLTEQTTLMILGDTSWLGWKSGQVSGHIASPAQDPQPDGIDQR